MNSAIESVASDWTEIAMEPICVEFIKGVFYGFGSELATLRLFKKYRHCGDKVGQDYSSNLESFYFRLET